jgi:glycosyltransferase involved in cell wall biosynthesis
VPPLSDRRLAWLYQNCAAFIATSCIEGFCLPLLEALFFNCRVVVSDILIFHEIAGDIPVYFDLSNTPVENLAVAVLEALNAEPRRQSARLQFSRSNTAAECFSLYSLLLPAAARAGSEGREQHSAAVPE